MFYRQQLKRLENCAHRDECRLTVQSQLIAIVAAVVLVGCGEAQQSAPAPESKPVEPVAEVPAQPSSPPPEAKPVEPVAEAARPEPPTAKAPDISIHKAADEGNIEAVKQHIAAGTDVNAKEKYEKTPLHHAAKAGYYEIVEVLIAEGADVNAMNDYGGTPLHYAAHEGHKETVKLLVAKGADANAKNKQRHTPLHLATSKEIAELLIAKGADVNAKQKGGGTPLDLAIQFKEPETADLLRKHGGKTADELKAEGK